METLTGQFQDSCLDAVELPTDAAAVVIPAGQALHRSHADLQGEFGKMVYRQDTTNLEQQLTRHAMSRLRLSPSPSALVVVSAPRSALSMCPLGSPTS